MADLISRKAAIEALGRFSLGETDTVKLSYRMYNYLKRLPTVDAVPVHGRWKIKTVMKYDLSYGGRIYIPEYVCGCCGHYYESYVRGDEPIMPEDADFPRFCPNCGAKMEVEHGNQS